jgi:hypothetical protein
MSESPEQSAAWAQLQSDIETALGRWLSERRGGGMSGQWFLMCDYIDGEGEPGWLTVCTPGQRLSQTVQLVEWGRLSARQASEEYLRNLGDGDG